MESSDKFKKAKLLVKDGKFTDPDFPPDANSIIGFGERRMPLDRGRSIPWLRPEVYFGGAQVKVYETIYPNDIE